MKRLRALAALLGCLAVLASGLMTVAAATMRSGPAPIERGTVGEPCSHCDDCDGAPCPVPTASCVQACSGVTPSLIVAAFAHPIVQTGQAHRSPGAVVLSGLSPPPDPFPPRA